MEGQEGHEWQEGHEGHEGQEGHVHKLEFLQCFKDMRRPAWTFLLLLHLNCSISNCARNGTQTRDDRKSLLLWEEDLMR